MTRPHPREQTEADARQSNAEHDLLLEALLLFVAAHERMASFGVQLAQQLMLGQHRRALQRDAAFYVVLLEEILSLLRGAAWLSGLVVGGVSRFGA